MRYSEYQLILFDVFPDLKEKIGWISLAFLPTPVHQLTHLGHKNLWIKRDDKTSSIYGGNKVRKLEFILADTIKHGKSHIVSMGAIGTNHGLALAIFCKRLGLSCSLLLYEQPATEYVRQNMLLSHKYNAEMIYTKSMFNAGIHFYLWQRRTKKDAYFLYAGGSTPIGALGFVNAAFELKKQIDDDLIPMPKYIFCPLGTNGTMAGLALGVLLAELDTTVIGVRVIESHLGLIPLATPETIKSLMEKTYQLLKSNSKLIPKIEIQAPCVLNEYYGEGYGKPTQKGSRAQDLLKSKENIILDPAYTAKTFAAVLDFIKDFSHKNENILYWHTYNSVDLSHEAESVDYHDLPVALQQFFE